MWSNSNGGVRHHLLLKVCNGLSRGTISGANAVCRRKEGCSVLKACCGETLLSILEDIDL